MKNKCFLYFVEGDDEKKLINTLKNPLGLIQAGKVQKLNVVENKISLNVLRTLKRGTVVILVFDTDTNNVDILNQNIKTLHDSNFVSKVITVPQVKNLEDELVRACDIKSITKLLNSRSKKDFKSDLIRVSNLDIKLKEHDFDIRLFWNKNPDGSFRHIHNDSNEIKK